MALRINRTPPEVMVRRWADWRAKRERKIAKADRRPRVVNTETARGLTDTRERVFRGRKYRVPPLAFPEAARIMEHVQRLHEIQSSDTPNWSELTDWFHHAASLAKQAARPKGAIRRTLWHLTPNPFRRGTLQEVADLLGFISAWVMIELAPRPTRNGDRLGTSPQTSRDS